MQRPLNAIVDHGAIGLCKKCKRNKVIDYSCGMKTAMQILEQHIEEPRARHIHVGLWHSPSSHAICGCCDFHNHIRLPFVDYVGFGRVLQIFMAFSFNKLENQGKSQVKINWK
ncbi:uncharacterized protein ACNLHF_008384 isoform 1-T2 [Anomaloglossus baeobatrachus]